MISMRALCLEPHIFDPELTNLLREHGIEAICAECTSQRDLIGVLAAARDSHQPVHAIFARLGLAFDAEFFAVAGPELRVLLTPTTGLSHIDITAASRSNVTLVSLKGRKEFLRTITSTAEQTWALLLAVLRHIPTAHQDVVGGRWDRVPHQGTELYGKTLGILGLGRLGTIVAGYGRAFMMKVVACDLLDEPFYLPENGHVERAEFDDVIRRADVLSIHLPLEQDTTGIVDRRRIGLLKHGAFLVNTARGEIVDEAALLHSLETGALAGVGLDVLTEDAVWDSYTPPHHPLIAYARTHHNLILSPHLGGYTLEAITRTRSFLVSWLLEHFLLERT